MTENQNGDRIPVNQAVRERYRDRCDQNRARQRALVSRSRILSLVRLVLFAGMVVLLIVGLWDLSRVKAWALAAAGTGFFVFLLVARYHDRTIWAARRHRDLLGINQHALLRLDRKWIELPGYPRSPGFGDNPLAADLDLAHPEENRASLLRLLACPSSPSGRQHLYRWLTEPADPAIIRARQAAADELSPQLDWRQELELTGRELLERPHDPEPFLEWADGERWLAGRGWLVWTARIVPVLTLSLLALGLAGVLPNALKLLELVGIRR